MRCACGHLERQHYREDGVRTTCLAPYTLATTKKEAAATVCPCLRFEEVPDGDEAERHPHRDPRLDGAT